MARMIIIWSLGVLGAGCSAVDYPRVSGTTYYAWLSSSYSPVVQFRQHRLDGEGICFQFDGGKTQIRGFVTHDDMDWLARKHPGLYMEAAVYQQAFTEGMSKGMADILAASTMDFEEKAGFIEKLECPVHLSKYVSLRRSGWDHGYSYGQYFVKNLDGCAE